jgi:predicted NBD/HSP70 family sugar kinase
VSDPVKAAPLRTTERRLLNALADRPANRAELVQLTGLSRTTVVATVAGLVQRGLLLEEPADGGHRPVGRPAARLRLTAPVEPLAVLTLGREASELLVCDFAASVAHEGGLGVSVASDLDDIADAVQDQLNRWGTLVSAAVVSLPLPFQPGRGVHPIRQVPEAARGQYCHVPALAAWLSTDFTPDLGERLGCPVIAENDANLAALGEATSGAGRGLGTVLYVCIKDGVGAGIVLDGRLHRGASGVAGELAHVTVDDQGTLCLCGNRGCIATVWGGPKLTWSVSNAYGHDVTFQDLQNLAEYRDAGVVRILADLGRTLGRPLAALSVLLNPDVIVVDGSLGHAATPVVAGIEEMITRHTPGMVRDAVRVVTGELGPRAVVAGAVSLAQASHVAELLFRSAR